MRKLIWAAFAALLSFASPALAQSTTRTFFYAYDLAATSATYGSYADQVKGIGTVTAAASTTLTADVTAQTPFDLVGVGDILVIQTAPNTFTLRKVTAKASNISLTISGSALTVTAVPWNYQHFTSGTGATIGWLPTAGTYSREVTLDFTTLSGTGGIDVNIQCRGDSLDTTGGNIYTVNVPAAVTTRIPIGETCASIRVGIAWHTAATGTDVLAAYLRTEPAPK